MKRPVDAFTLLEVMIVLSIVISLLAIAWPRMRGQASRAALREAALEVKSALAEARDLAVRQGTEIRVLYGNKPSVLRIAGSKEIDLFDEQEVLDLQNDLPAHPDLPADTPEHALMRATDSAIRLPPGIYFGSASESAFDDAPEIGAAVPMVRGQQADVIDLRDTRSTQRRFESVTFYPDGRGTTCTIDLESDQTGESISLQVRGLTGSVTLGQVQKTIASANRKPSRESSLGPQPADVPATTQIEPAR